jgi:hypothetical protein
MGRKKTAKMAQEDESLLIVDSVDFIDEVRRYLSVNHVKRLFGLGTELFGAAGPFLEKPTWWTAAQSLFSMGKVMVEDVEVYADDFFAGDEWTEPYSADFNQTLLHVLQKFPYERIKTTEENTFVRVCTMPNQVKVGWTYTGRTQQVDHVYVETDHLEEARAYIKQLLWDQFQGKSLVMRKNTRVVIGGDDDARVIFEVDDDFQSKLSKRAVDFAAQLERPLKEGVSRSIMLYGPPGTGKSTMARTVVELMKLRSFRIRIADLGGLDNGTLFEAINIFEPDAVILDDFDRAHGQAQLLETLEFFQQKVKLVIVTVNNRRELDDALMRPGRIDVLELIDHMDEEVVKHVLGPYVDGYELVKGWPIAFIAEYVKRRKYMTVEEAADSVKELTRRVDELQKYRGDDDEGQERMMKILMKKMRKEAKAAVAAAALADDDADAEDEIEVVQAQGGSESDSPLDDC